MRKPAIIVIAYNREDSLNRLLKSLSKADYPYDSGKPDIPLIISIDKSDNPKVAGVANDFVWRYGEKRVVCHETRLGLKNHVLKCGNYIDEFERIIVLEDDLYVSKGFYKYASCVLEFVSGDEKVAGVSLYNHLLNVHVREPFEAVNDGFDNYYMQFAQSWGQAYTKEQWHGFLNWMSDNDAKPVAANNVPANVSSWSDKSWLKYYIKYVIDTDKYFIYPRVSYTTNFGDEGTHAEAAVSDLQVPFSFNSGDAAKGRDFYFSKIDESGAVYDSFFENILLKSILKDEAVLDSESIEIDLYGYKPVAEHKYFVSSKALPYKVIRSYARKLRPIDANILEEITGNDFYLYDTSVSAPSPLVSESERVLYNYRALNLKKIVSVLKYRILKK